MPKKQKLGDLFRIVDNDAPPGLVDPVQARALRKRLHRVEKRTQARVQGFLKDFQDYVTWNRIKHGLTQSQLGALTGISLRHTQRLLSEEDGVESLSGLSLADAATIFAVFNDDLKLRTLLRKIRRRASGEVVREEGPEATAEKIISFV